MATAETLTAETLMTAEEFAKRPDPGCPEELVKGRIVRMAPPNRRHGEVCSQTAHLFRLFVDKYKLGRILINDSGIITKRDPDTVRGADIAYYSYARMPKGPVPPDYGEGAGAPELVVEVRSPGNSWRDIQIKVGEYISAGVLYVVVLDPGNETAHLFGVDDPPRILGSDDELTIPAILGDFRERIGRFFE
jgi:Uma2 family endonuclease